MLVLLRVWLEGLRTLSEARQLPSEVPTLKSKLPRQTLPPVPYGIGRTVKLKISTRSHMLTEWTHAGSVLCTRGLPFSREIAGLCTARPWHLLAAQSFDFCLPELGLPW